MREKTENFKTSDGDIKLVDSHKHLIQKRKALLAQDDVNTALKVLLHIKVARLSLLKTTIPIYTKVAHAKKYHQNVLYSVYRHTF